MSRIRTRQAARSPKILSRQEIIALDDIKNYSLTTPNRTKLAHKLAKEGFINTSGTWKLTTKGEKILNREDPTGSFLFGPWHRRRSHKIRTRKMSKPRRTR